MKILKIGKSDGREERGTAGIIATLMLLAVTMALSASMIQLTQQLSKDVASSINSQYSACVKVSGSKIRITNPTSLAIDLSRIKLIVDGEKVRLSDANGNGIWEPFEVVEFSALSDRDGDGFVIVALYLDNREVFHTIYAKPIALHHDEKYPQIRVNVLESGGRLKLNVELFDDAAILYRSILFGDINGKERIQSDRDFIESLANKHGRKVKEILKDLRKEFEEFEKHGRKGTMMEELMHSSETVEIPATDLEDVAYIRIIAKDATGKTSSKIITLTQLLPPVSVKIIKPKDGDVFLPTETIDVKAVASNASKVSLQVDGVTVFEKDVESNPYIFGKALVLSEGKHEIKAIARNAAHSAEDKITVHVKNSSPSVKIEQPSEGDKFIAAGSAEVNVIADTVDDTGLKSISLYVDGSLKDIRNVEGAKYKYQHSLSLSPGKHTIKVLATDRYGKLGEDSVNIEVVADKPPSVKISQPSDGQIFWTTDLATITIRALASDDVGISRVEFYDNDKLIVADNSPPYSATATLSVGVHTIKAVAYDTANQKAEDGVKVYVKRDNPPIIKITSPSDGAKLSDKNVVITADARDDRGITKVIFYVDDKQIAVDYSEPYVVYYTFSTGIHRIKAVAYDTLNQSSSDEIAVNFIDNPPTVKILEPQDGKTYYGNDVVVRAVVEDDIGLKSVKVEWISGTKYADEIALNQKIYNLEKSLKLNEGTWKIRVVAYDTSGNIGSDEVTIHVISQPPEIIGAYVPEIGWSTDFSNGIPVVGGVA
ncbi:hypothetical protein DRP05_13160 [Archaeoglobales archaeon]|mgnify:FL=1|nr:MAG: hypothetical protein DRP05_13160 [Archaeoglobales archaeon]